MKKGGRSRDDRRVGSSERGTREDDLQALATSSADSHQGPRVSDPRPRAVQADWCQGSGCGKLAQGPVNSRGCHWLLLLPAYFHSLMGVCVLETALEECLPTHNSVISISRSLDDVSSLSFSPPLSLCFSLSLAPPH